MVENRSETEPTNHHYRAATLHNLRAFDHMCLTAECCDFFKLNNLMTYCVCRAVHRPSSQLLAVKVSCGCLMDNFLCTLRIFIMF